MKKILQFILAILTFIYLIVILPIILLGYLINKFIDINDNIFLKFADYFMNDN